MKNQFERNSTEQTCLACGETFDNRTGHYGQRYSNAANSSEEFCLCEGCAEDAHRQGVISTAGLNSDVLSTADFETLRKWGVTTAREEYEVADNAIATALGCTPAQVKAQFAKNAKQLFQMADQAKRTGKKVNGYTEEQLRNMATNAATRGQACTEEEMAQENADLVAAQISQVLIYDNGGATIDRYTALFPMFPREKDDAYYALAFNNEPFHPQGFGQHCSAVRSRYLGKRIKFESLNADCQKLIKAEFITTKK